MRKPSDNYYATFPTYSSTGAATNADSLPTATARCNGTTDGAFTLTVANLSTGLYKITGTVPSGYAAGDSVQIEVAATIATVAAKAVVDSFVIDTKRVSDLNDSAYAGGAVASVTAPVDTNANQTETDILTAVNNLTATGGSGDWAVTITGLPAGASTKMTRNLEVWTRPANESGETPPYNLNTGDYLLRITAPGYDFTPETVTISADVTLTRTMTAIVIAQPDDPLRANVAFFAQDQGVAEDGIAVTLKIAYKLPFSIDGVSEAQLQGDGVIGTTGDGGVPGQTVLSIYPESVLVAAGVPVQWAYYRVTAPSARNLNGKMYVPDTGGVVTTLIEDSASRFT